MKKGGRFRYLIEPNLVLQCHFHLLPDLIGDKIKFFKKGMFRIKAWLDHCPLLKNWVYASGLYDGMELSLIPTGTFDCDWNIVWNQVNHYKKSKLPIYTFHACFENAFPWFGHAYFNLAEDSPKTRKALLAQLCIADTIKPQSIIVFHPGIVDSQTNAKKGLKNIVRNLESVLDYAEERKLTIALENMNKIKDAYMLGTVPEELLYIFDRINSPSLKMTFDWGHANTTNPKSDFEYIENFIKTFSTKIVYAHIHYNKCHRNVHSDEHLPLTRIPWDELGDFKRTIDTLIKETAISDYGFIHLEINPKKIFKLIRLIPGGASSIEQVESLYLLRNMIEKGIISYLNEE